MRTWALPASGEPGAHHQAAPPAWPRPPTHTPRAAAPRTRSPPPSTHAHPSRHLPPPMAAPQHLLRAHRPHLHPAAPEGRHPHRLHHLHLHTAQLCSELAGEGRGGGAPPGHARCRRFIGWSLVGALSCSALPCPAPARPALPALPCPALPRPAPPSLPCPAPPRPALPTSLPAPPPRSGALPMRPTPAHPTPSDPLCPAPQAVGSLTLFFFPAPLLMKQCYLIVTGGASDLAAWPGPGMRLHLTWPERVPGRALAPAQPRQQQRRRLPRHAHLNPPSAHITHVLTTSGHPVPTRLSPHHRRCHRLRLHLDPALDHLDPAGGHGGVRCGGG